MKFTVLGSSGFIGRSMVSYLRDQDFQVNTPDRDVSDLQGENLGHVIYAIGLTGDFRTRMRETIDAHVSTLQRLMNGAGFESWLYLSSTRLYNAVPEGVPVSEDTPLPVRPDADSIYNLSKLLGEAICLAQSNPFVRVARLSNVYGAGMSHHNFLGSLIHDALKNGKVTIGEAPQSAKDYIAIEDVLYSLKNIALCGKERLYNVASGRSTTHQELANVLHQSGYDIQFAQNSRARVFPQIDTTRIRREFPGSGRSVLEDLPELINHEKTEGSKNE